MTRMTRALGVLLFLLASLPARATTNPEAAFTAAVTEAVEHRRAGRHEQALEALDRALVAIRQASGPRFDQGRSRVRFYQALSLEALGRLDDAEAILSVLVTAAGLSEDELRVVGTRLAAVRKALDERARNKPGKVTVVALDQDGKAVAAYVRVDGGAVGAAPVTMTLAPGPHRVEVWGDRLQRATQTFEVAPGSTGRILVRVHTVTKTITQVVEPVFDPPAGAWAVAGSGLALVAVGAALHALGFDEVQQATRAPTRAAGLAQEEAGQVKAYTGYALYAVGGALLVGGISWLLVDGWRDPGVGTPSVVGFAGGGALLVTGRF